MASFGAGGITGDWLSGGSLQDAVGLGQPAVAPKPQTFDWRSWSPTTPVHGIDDTGLSTTGSITAMMNSYNSAHPHASLAAPIGGGATTGTGADTVSLGGDWAGVDQWNSAIQSAANAFGLDPNDLKGIMKEESNGDPGAIGAPGVGGLMQVNDSVWGSGAWSTDNAANIMKGAEIYSNYLKQYNGDKKMALEAYHGFGTDYVNGVPSTTAEQYANIVMTNINQLSQGAASGGMASGDFGTGLGAPTGNTPFNVITGQSAPTISQGFGWTDFAANSSYAQSGAYDYTSDYTVDGKPMGHAGVDVALTAGSALYAPVSGTVVDAGGTGFYCDADEGMCGPGSGELRIRLANGDEVILGHMRNINVAVGSTISAGQSVGVSGSENGGHVHVEYRKWVGNGVTKSGFEVIDPRTILGSGSLGTSTGTGAAPIASDPWSNWRARHVGG